MGVRPEPATLSELVTELATSLMTVGPSSLVETCQLMLRRVVSAFDVDLSFVRRNDHARAATILLAEWPPRVDVPDPDPLGVVLFADADPVFAALETLSDVVIARPDATNPNYQRRVRDGSGISGVSSVTVPMLRGGVTTGALGLVKYGDRDWSTAEVTALTALAGLLAQALSRVAAEAELRYIAYHDELTGLFNRRALLDHLADRLEPNGSESVAILVLVLDRLKALNEFLGHGAGEQFMRSVAHRLDEQFGPTDFVARLDGDELVVVLSEPGTTEQAVEIARTVRAIVTAPVHLGDNVASRTVSVGVAAARPGQTSVLGLLAQADQAANVAKAQGGNRIVAFTEEMRAGNDERADVEVNLRSAIGNGELTLHYQPQVDLMSGRLLGAEALVRWNHPTRGLLFPDSFVGVAESTNLSGELGRWVLDSACHQLAAWQRQFDLPEFRLGVNVSAAELITTGLAEDVAAVLHRNGIDAGKLTLEITETAFVADLRRARETLQALTELGVHLAIDDFGTGYSSFAQLKTLPVETLKIDRGFVTDVADNRDDRAIVRSIIELASSFGMQTMAEGVETAEARAVLIELGCHQAQGYLIGRPAPAEGMRSFLLGDQARAVAVERS